MLCRAYPLDDDGVNSYLTFIPVYRQALCQSFGVAELAGLASGGAAGGQQWYTEEVYSFVVLRSFGEGSVALKKLCACPFFTRKESEPLP